MEKKIEMLELIIGQVPEAIYFGLFMIFAKDIKEKRILFTILMIAEYLLLKYGLNLHYDIWFQILYTFLTFAILKMLYKEKSQITDIFTFTIASVFLMLSSIICFFITGQNALIASIINRPLLFIIILLLNYKLNKIQKIYKIFWNRNDKINKIMKSTTFRCINIIVFNISFYILNTVMLYCLFLRK